MLRIIFLILCFFLGGMLGTGPVEASSITTKIIINKSNNQLAFYQDGQLVRVFPVATGRHISYTPEGSFKIINKIVEPYYVKARIPGGSPNNPLGRRWMGLNAGGGTYGIHGNSNPASIGTYASGGCIRMFNEDVIWLYDRIPIGTPVQIINHPLNFKAQEQKPKVTVKLNGKVIEFPPEAGPIIRSDQLFLPARKLVEQLGYQLQWDGHSKTLVLANSDKQIFFTINSKNCSINMISRKTDHAPILHNSHSYLPLYFFDQILGAEVVWDQKEYQAILETKDPISIGEPVPYNLEVMVNGKKAILSREDTPLLFGNHILIPVKSLGEALGLEVSWNEEREAVFIRDKDNNLLILPAESNSGLFNGADFSIYPQIIIKDGTTFVSIDDLARAYSLNVQCSHAAGQLLLTKKTLKKSK